MKISKRLQEYLHLPGFVSDIIFVVLVIGAISVLSQAALGLWTPMVAVESGSMVPNLNIGDIVIVQGASRTTVISQEEAKLSGYTAFNMPGDVILFRPYGKERLTIIDQAKALIGIPYQADKATPIIHRALRWIEKGQPMWEGGPAAPFSGYITKGDHNDRIDQIAGGMLGVANESYLKDHADQVMEISPGSIYLDKKTGLVIYLIENKTYVGQGISYLAPVKKEWIIGVARARIPIIGYVRLIPNIIADEIRQILGAG